MPPSELPEGTKLRVVIDEDGTPKPPALPLGIVRRRLIGPDKMEYYLVVLDEPVTCLRAKTGSEWTLRELALSASFAGDFLGRLMDSSHGGFIHVGIANVVQHPYPLGEFLDPAKVAYFARGRILKP
jgi:hypothetical protein